MWYFVDGVLILKDSVWPAFTLIDVANPWIEESPAPSICQSEGASPGSWFSQTIGFDVHAARADCARSAPKARSRERQSDREGEQPQPRRNRVGRR